MKCWYILLITSIVSRSVLTKRVLIVTNPVRSHFLENAAVSRALVARGHEVYAVVSTAFPQGQELLARGVTPLLYHTDAHVQSVAQIVANSVEIDEPIKVSNGLTPYCRSALRDKHLRDKITQLQFDLALVDGFEFNYCSFLLPYLHRIPFAMMFSSLHPWTSGTPSLPSFSPIGHFQGDLQFNDAMSFMERLENAYWFAKLYWFIGLPGRYDNSLLQEFAPEIDSWDYLVQKSVLFIQTRDHMLDWPAPNMPNFITTPGVTTRPAKPLPDDIKQIMDSSNDGVIFMSFGSIASRFPSTVLDNLVEALNQFQTTVIWALSAESLVYVENKVRSNVHVLLWVPQNDILGHNNTKMFVTHCGNNGQYEALYHGVPMVGLPMFGEQPHNAFRIQDHGYGVSLLPKTMMSFSPEDLVAAIKEVASNRQYKENVERASAILQDRPMLPAETIAFWLEHVMRHGSTHLRSRGIELPWYQFFMFDILLCIHVVVVGLVLVVCCLAGRCVKMCGGKKTKRD